MRFFGFIVLGTLVLTSCISIPEVGEEGQPCTKKGKCLPGLVCDVTTNTCVKTSQPQKPAKEGSVLASSGGKMSDDEYKLLTVTGESSVIGRSSDSSLTERGGFGSRLKSSGKGQ